MMSSDEEIGQIIAEAWLARAGVSVAGFRFMLKFTRCLNGSSRAPREIWSKDREM